MSNATGRTRQSTKVAIISQSANHQIKSKRANEIANSQQMHQHEGERFPVKTIF